MGAGTAARDRQRRAWKGWPVFQAERATKMPGEDGDDMFVVSLSVVIVLTNLKKKKI